MISMNRSLLKTALAVGVGVVVSAIVTASVSVATPIAPQHGPPISMETMIQIKLFVATFSVVLLLFLLWNYISIYRDLPNRFTLGLLLFTVALLLYGISSSPLLHLLLGFRPGVTPGPFTFLPDLFASVAVIILLYQSYS